MLLLTKVHLYGNTKIITNNWLPKRFLTQVNSEVENCGGVFNESKKIFHKFLIPSSATYRLKEIDKITGLTVKMGHISWAKVSIHTSQVTEWNFQSHPEDFKNFDEVSVLKLAYNLKKIIPVSDLYVMEKSASKEKTKILNDVRLSSMLMVLLNNFTSGIQESDKLVFQTEKVMNKVYNLLIGNERMSSRKVFEAIIDEIKIGEKINVAENRCSIHYFLSKIELEYLEFYDKSSLAQQECLSFALLLVLSFIDVFIYQNVENLNKIRGQTKFTKIKT